jgi:hypothetical protein
VSRTVTPLPERLRTAGATELEHRLLGAAARELPSQELTARMAAAIGVSAPPPSVAPSPPAGTGIGGPAPVAATRPLVGWVAGAAAVVAVSAAIVAVRSGAGSSQPVASPAAAQAPRLIPSATERPPESQPAERESPSNAVETTSPQRGRLGPPAADLGDQIALIDSARTAVAAGSGERALEILRKYQGKYPTGGFRPEAAALKIEALMKVGRTAEARALAERFIADHPGTPLAERVTRIADLRRVP